VTTYVHEQQHRCARTSDPFNCFYDALLIVSQVRGTEALQEFSNYLMQPHQPDERPEFSDQVTQLQEKVGQLTHQCQQLQQQLDKAKGTAQ